MDEILTEEQLKSGAFDKQRNDIIEEQVGTNKVPTTSTTADDTEPKKGKKYDLKSLQENFNSSEQDKLKYITDPDGNSILVEDRMDYKRGQPEGKTIELNQAEYAPYMDQVRIERDFETLNKTRATNQSHWEQFGGFLNQALLGEVVGGTISAVGSLFEIPSLIYEKAVGETSDFNNSIMSLGQGLIDWTRQASPIHRENPDTAFDIGDPAWWFSNGVSVASAASMLVPAKGTMSAMSWLNQIATNVGKATGGKTGKLLQVGANMGKVEKALAKQATSALVMRHAENTREAFGVVNDVKTQMLNRFDDDAEWEDAKNSPAAKELQQQGKEVNKLNMAEYIASRAGYRSYAINFSNIIFDFIQAGALLKGNAFTRSKVVDAEVKKKLGTASLIPGVERAKSIVGTVATQSTEGIEEAINYIGEKEGKNFAELLSGKDTDSFGTRMGTYVSDPHMWETAFWGAVGGVTFDAIGSVFSGNTGKEVAAMQMAAIAKREQSTINYTKQIAAIKEGVANKTITVEDAKGLARDAKAQMSMTMGLHASQLGSVNVLLQQLGSDSFKQELLANTTVEELQEIGIDDIDKAIAHTIEDVKLTESIYNKTSSRIMSLDIEDKHKGAIITSVVSAEFENRKQSTKAESYKNEINGHKRRNTEFANQLKNDPSLEHALRKEGLVTTIEQIDSLITYYESQNKTEIALDYKTKKEDAIKAIEEIDSLFPTLPSTDKVNKHIKEFYLKLEGSQNIIDYNNRLIDDLTSEKGAQKKSGEFTDWETKKEEAKTNARLRQFEDKITTLSKNVDIDTAISSLKAELTGKEADSKEYKFIQKKLDELEDKKEYQRKNPKPDAPLPPPVNEKEVYDDIIDTDEFHQKLEIELEGKLKYEKFLDAVDAEMDSTKTLEAKIKALKSRRDSPNQADKALRRKYLDGMINLLQREQQTDLGAEVKGIKAGTTYIFNDIKYTVKSMYEDGNGDTFIVAEKEGVNTLLRLDEFSTLLSTGLAIEDISNLTDTRTYAEKLADLTTELTDATTQEQKDLIQQQINELNRTEKLIAKQPVTTILSDVTSPVTSILELFNKASNLPAVTQTLLTTVSEQYKTQIETIDDASQNFVAQYDWETNTIKVNLYRLKKGLTVEDFINDVLIHEAIHAALHNEVPYWKDGNVPVERSDFNKQLLDIIETLEASRDSDLQSVLDLIQKEKTKHPEELLAYILGHQEVFQQLYLEQPVIIDAIETFIKTNIKDSIFVDLFNQRKTNSTKPTNPNIKITPAARQFAIEFQVNLEDVVGTGQNGRITIGDVKKYYEDNNVVPPKEVLHLEDLSVQVLETSNSNNLFLAAIVSGINDGVVDVEHYKRELAKYGIKTSITQAQLESSVRAVLSPTLNEGSTVELKATAGGIAIYHDATIIGFLNNPKNLERDYNFAYEVGALKTTADVHRFIAGKTFGQKEKDLIRWKFDELKGESKNKPFSSHVFLMKNQLDSATEIKRQFDEIMSATPNAKITTSVTRKTSGNLLQVEEFIPVSEAMPHINEVFFVDDAQESGGTKTTLISSNDPAKQFSRNPNSTNYFDYDKSYSSGRLYILVEGANSIPHLINSHIPVRLNQGNVNQAGAEAAYEHLMELIDEMRALKKENWLDIQNNDKVKAAKAKLNEYFNVTSSDQTASDYIQIFNDRIEFNFGENFTGNIYLSDMEGFGSKKALNLVVNDGSQVEDNPNFIKEGKTTKGKRLPFKVTDRKTGEKKDIHTLNGLTREAEFKTALVKAFTQKRHNVDFKLLKSKEVYKGHDSYLQYLLKEGVLTTDTRMLKDSKGNTMKDRFGNPLPSVTSKNTDKAKNSNLVLSIGVNLSANGKPTVQNQSKKLVGVSTSNKKDSANLTPTEALKTTDTGLVTAEDVTLAVNALAQAGELIVENEDYAFAIQTSPKLYELLSGNQIIVPETLPDGTVKLSIGVDNSGISRNKIVTNATADPKVKEDEASVKAWWAKTFGENVPLDMDMMGVIMNQGQQAWGVFSHAMVRLSKDAPKGTAYHESFHVVFWLYKTEEQRAELLKEATDKYGNLTNVELEEMLADDFSDYMMKDGKTAKVDGKIKGFFAKLLSWIKGFFTKTQQSAINETFAEIDSGKFNYKPDQRMVDYAKGINRNMIATGFTRMEEAEIVSLLSRKIIEFQKLHPNLSLLDIQNDETLNPKNQIIASLRMDMRMMMRSRPEKGQNILRVIQHFDAFFDASNKNIKRQFGVNLSEELSNITDFEGIDKQWDDSKAFDVSQKDSVSNYIKGEIMTTPLYSAPGVKNTDTFLGMETYLDFNKVYPYIQRNMIGALDVKEMLDRMETMAQHDPSLYELIAKLNSDANFKAAWVSQFKKQIPNKVLVLYGQEGIKLEQANKNVNHFILGDKWFNTFSTKLDTDVITGQSLTALQKEFVEEYSKAVYHITGDNNIGFVENLDSILELTEKVLNEIGINLSQDIINKIISSKVNQNYHGSPEKVYHEIMYKNIISILNEIATQDKKIAGKKHAMEEYGEVYSEEELKLTPDSINRFNNIALAANVYQYDLIESSYFDVKGNNVFATANPSYLSDFFDKVRAVSNPQYAGMNEAKDALLASLKQFAQDPAMSFSNWLWSSEGIPGALIVPEGGRNIELLGTEHLNMEFLNNWAYSMLDGVKNTDTNEGYQYSTMPDKAWEMNNVIMYAEAQDGYVHVPIMIPSDSGNISFITSPRIKGNVGNSVPITSPLFRAVKNTVLQDIARMKTARDLLFTYNVAAGTWQPKEHRFVGSEGFDSTIHVDLTKLEKNYYWEKQGKAKPKQYTDSDILSAIVNDYIETVKPDEIYYVEEGVLAEPGFIYKIGEKHYNLAFDIFENSSTVIEMSKEGYELINDSPDIVKRDSFFTDSQIPFISTKLADLFNDTVVNIDGLKAYFEKEGMTYNPKIKLDTLTNTLNLDNESKKNIKDLVVDNSLDVVVEMLKGQLEYNRKEEMALPIIATQDSDDNWTPTGGVFKFNNIQEAQDIPNMFHKGMFWGDLWGDQQTRTDLHTAVNGVVTKFINGQIAEGHRVYGHTKAVLEQTKGYAQKYSNFNEFITEYQINHFLSNVEQTNYFVGNQAEFGAKGKGKNAEKVPAKDIVKRAKHVSAPGVSGSNTIARPTFKGASIKDVELKSSNYDMIVNRIADAMKRDNSKFAGLTITMEELRKKNPDFTKMNILDKAVYKLTSGYLSVNIGDGQGYMSVNRAEEVIRDYGRWNLAYENLFEKVRAGKELNVDELTIMLQPFKPFYYGRDYNSYTNRHMSNQVKNSLTVAIPQLVKGTHMEKVVAWMDKNNLDELYFESAEKVGTQFVIDITDGNGGISQETLDFFSTDNGYAFRDYQQANWRIQLDVPDHMMDSQNKLGTQIAKIIIGNLPANAVYNVAGDNYSRDEFIAHYMDVMMQNIIEDGNQLREDIGVEMVNGEPTIVNMEKLSKVLMSEVERRGISDNYLEAITLDENGQFNMPLFINSMGTKWESILTSLFTNRVVDQKVPGGSGVLLSSAFMQPIDGITSDTSLPTGIKWSKEIVDRGDYKLRMSRSEETGVITAEALLPAWSKQFFIQNENGDMVLDDIDNIPDSVKTMVSYRIPTEQDYSVTVFKVVGFLPSANGSTIVLPEEYVAAKGFDFDVDKEFIMYHHFDAIDVDGKRHYQKHTYDKGIKNTRKSRDNRILDIFIAKLLNPLHFSGIVTPQSFEDGKNVINEINDITKEKGSGVNPATSTAQLEFRKQNIAGRALKGMAANSNAFLSVAQVAKMELGEDVAFHVKYRTGELTAAEIEFNDRMEKEKTPERSVIVYDVQELEKKYGKDNVIVETIVKDSVKTNKGDNTIQIINFTPKDVFTVKPIKSVDKKAIGKASIATQYIGYGESKPSSSTTAYANQVRVQNPNIVNSGRYSKNDIIFVSIPGKFRPGINKTIQEVQKAIDAGATLLTDNAKYLETSTYNDGERALAEYLRKQNMIYSETVVKGQTIGVWKKSENTGQQIFDFTQNVEPTITGKFVTVKHDKLAWNEDGTYTNIDGENTMIHASQMLAMILDIVKEGIPFNVDTYTFSSFVTMLNTGISIRYASMFIRQPILKSLSNTFFETQGFIEDERTGKEIEITKREYLTKLYKVARKLDKPFKMYREQLEAMDSDILNGDLLDFSKTELLDNFKIDTDDVHAFDVQELKINIKRDVEGKMTEQEEYDFLVRQIKVLEMFKRYKKAGEAYDDMIKATGTDRTSVGPSLSRPEMLNRAINQATYYLQDTTVEEVLARKNFDGTIYNVGSVEDLKDQIARGLLKKGDMIQIEKGARVYVKVDGRKIPATKAIYPNMFGESHDSKYPVLETYKEEAFDSAIEVFGKMFIKQSPAYMEATRRVMRESGLRFNAELADKVSNYVTTYLQNDLNWFKAMDSNRVIGLDVDVNVNEELTFEQYAALSTANKVAYVQNKHKDILANDTHVLNYLMPKLDDKSIAKRTIHSIDFVNTKTDALTDDRLVDSFQEMWDSSDVYLSDLAKDLVYYSHLTSGLAMRKNSFSKLIPTKILSDVKLNEFLYEILGKSNNINYLDSKMFDLRDKFMRSHWNDSSIVPYVYTKYTKDGTLKNTPVWIPNLTTGVLQVNISQLKNEDTKVSRASYILVPIFETKLVNGKKTKIKIKDILYRRHSITETHAFYVPVDKLGNRNIMEFEDRSVIKDNQVLHAAELYEQVIETGKPVTAVNRNIVDNAYSIVTTPGEFNNADKKMFTTATAFIGDGILGELSNKFQKAFESKANMAEYSADSLVMIAAPRVIQGGMTAGQINHHMYNTQTGHLKGVYSLSYNVLKSGGTIMLRSRVDTDGKQIPSYGEGNHGNELLLKHFDAFVNDGRVFKKVENDVAYYSKLPFDNDILTNEETEALKDNKNYNPEGNC